MRHGFGKALRKLRRAQGLTQEDFAPISSRTYLSALERGKKSPTLDKINALANAIGVHLLTVITVASLYDDEEDNLENLLLRVRAEVIALGEREMR